jgi:hypothetical protein
VQPPFVTGQVCQQALRQHGLGETLRDDKRIVAERFKEFAQHPGLFGVPRHALDLSLQLLSRKQALPLIFQCLRVTQVVFDFLFQLRLRHHCIERWLAIRALFRPDSMAPVNSLNRPLICYTLWKGQRSFRNLR